MKEYIQLLPDWSKPEKVVLSLPTQNKGIRFRDEIVSDYAQFLLKNEALLQDGLKVVILYNKTTPQSTIDLLNACGAELLKIEANDIWIRDWAPVLAKQGNELIGLKFQYNAPYAYGPKQDNHASKTLASKLNFKQQEFDLIWEMGNFTTNGNGHIVVTDQILHQNKMKSNKDFQDYLIAQVGLTPDKTKIDVLKINDLYCELWDIMIGKPDQAICHIDGMMRFISPNVLVYHDYSINDAAIHSSHKGNLPKEKIERYIKTCQTIKDRVNQILREFVSVDIKIVTIPSMIDSITDDFSSEVLSDEGDYINYLRYGQRLILPQYSSCSNDNVANIYRALLGQKNVVLTNKRRDNTSFVDKLSSIGGVLNCASWVKYSI